MIRRATVYLAVAASVAGCAGAPERPSSDLGGPGDGDESAGDLAAPRSDGALDRPDAFEPPRDAAPLAAGDLGGADAAPGFVEPPALLKDDAELTLNGPADVPARRAALIQFLWGKDGFPSSALPSSVEMNVKNPIGSVAMTNLARVDRLVIDMGQGIKNEAFHFVPASPNGRLVIVHHGHLATLDSDLVGDTIAALVSEGYGVLGTLMPCYNSFPCPIKANDRPSPHNDFIAQIVPPTGDVMRYFVEHLPIALHYLRTRAAADGFPAYREFDMVGLSGGGWTTMLYAAIDPTITASFVCSGGKPMYLRHCPMPSEGCLDGYDGDREQMYFPLYKHVAGYLDLYAMGAAGAGRRLVQEQIRHDLYAFGQDQYNAYNGVPGLTWNQAVRAYESKLSHFFEGASDQGWYRYEIDETAAKSHVISPATQSQVILAELDGDRRPVGAASAADPFLRGPEDLLWEAPPAWQKTSVPVAGTPSVIEGGGDLDLFVRDPSSALVHLHAVQGGPWTTQAWPGVIASDPAGVRVTDDLHAVAVGADSRLWHWSQEGKGPVTMGRVDANTPVVGPPTLLASASDHLDAVIRRIDGGIQHVFWRGGPQWMTEAVGGGPWRGVPSAVVAGDGSLHVFARDAEDLPWEAAQSAAGGPWTFTSLADAAGVPGTRIGGSPGASIDDSQDLSVVVRLPSENLGRFESTVKNGMRRWSYAALARPMGAAPSAGTSGFTFSPVVVPGGLFARAVEGGLWLYTFGGGSWAWQAGEVH